MIRRVSLSTFALLVAFAACSDEPTSTCEGAVCEDADDVRERPDIRVEPEDDAADAPTEESTEDAGDTDDLDAGEDSLEADVATDPAGDPDDGGEPDAAEDSPVDSPPDATADSPEDAKPDDGDSGGDGSPCWGETPARGVYLWGDAVDWEIASLDELTAIQFHPSGDYFVAVELNDEVHAINWAARTGVRFGLSGSDSVYLNDVVFAAD